MFGISIQLSIFNGQTLWKWWEPENAFPPSPLPARENSTWEFQSLQVYGCLTVYNWSFLLTKLKPNRQYATKNKLLRKAPECPFNDYRHHLSSHCRLGERHWSLHGHDREMHFVNFRVHCVKCCGVACRYKKNAAARPTSLWGGSSLTVLWCVSLVSKLYGLISHSFWNWRLCTVCSSLIHLAGHPALHCRTSCPPTFVQGCSSKWTRVYICNVRQWKGEVLGDCRRLKWLVDLC